MQYLHASTCDVMGYCMQYIHLPGVHALTCAVMSQAYHVVSACTYCMSSKVSSLSPTYYHAVIFPFSKHLKQSIGNNTKTPLLLWRQNYY